MLVLYCLGFCMSRGVCKSRHMSVYSGLNWFPIRGSCLSLSLIGDHILVAIFPWVSVGSCLCVVACSALFYYSVTVRFVILFSVHLFK